ncbi:MAG: hypothetical protein KKA73_29645 [Chloroflexi bacterium]|nr:hypothetical protein [Chloroflexota bacterium]MBU1751862.1 hypothetical protein [Chloroflexota bacterium]
MEQNLDNISYSWIEGQRVWECSIHISRKMSHLVNEDHDSRKRNCQSNSKKKTREIAAPVNGKLAVGKEKRKQDQPDDEYDGNHQQRRDSAKESQKQGAIR